MLPLNYTPLCACCLCPTVIKEGDCCYVCWWEREEIYELDPEDNGGGINGAIDLPEAQKNWHAGACMMPRGHVRLRGWTAVLSLALGAGGAVRRSGMVCPCAVAAQRGCLGTVLLMRRLSGS